MRELAGMAGALRRWWWVVVVAAVVGGAGGAVSARATGGPQWVTSASIRLEADTFLPVPDGGNFIDLLPLQAVVDETMAATTAGVDASAAIARHGDGDDRRTVRITAAADDAVQARAGLDGYVARFRVALAQITARWATAAEAVLDQAIAPPGADDRVLVALRAAITELAATDPIAAADVADPSAPTSTLVVALLAALALASLTAAAVALKGAPADRRASSSP